MSVQDDLALAVENWQPNFEYRDTLAACADQINQPHEDYPLRVRATETLINLLTIGDYSTVSEADCLNVHKVLMADRLHIAGKWRTSTVRMGRSNYVPPAPLLVPELAQALFPFTPTSEVDLRQFYARFQCIHPFDDGNGRVGGILVAALSFLLFKKYLTPCQ